MICQFSVTSIEFRTLLKCLKLNTQMDQQVSHFQNKKRPTTCESSKPFNVLFIILRLTVNRIFC